MVTIRPSEWPLRNAPNGIPRPLGVYEDKSAYQHERLSIFQVRPAPRNPTLVDLIFECPESHKRGRRE